MNTTPNPNSKNDSLAKPGPNLLSGFLGNISIGRKMALMAFMLSLGILGIALSAYVGLQSLQYQFSNIYDFMLIPISSIEGAGTSLEEAQRFLVQSTHGNITAEERTKSISQVQLDNQAIEKIITRYDTEWVTTTSPQFTQDLKNGGKIDLQQQEVAVLAAYHKAYGTYKTTFAKYQATVQAGNPDVGLANDAITQLEVAQTQLQSLIDVNLKFADFSNSQAQQAFNKALTFSGIMLALGLVIGLVMSYLIAVSVTNRLGVLTRSAAAMQEGDLDQTIHISGNDEVSLLGVTFNSMITQLKDLFSTLEARVAERTKSLELASDVGRAVSQVRELHIMLKDAAELIRSRFNLYYVQVYLADPSQTNLILQSGTGSVGEQLISHGHHLPLDTGSINGRAAIEKKSVVISDTTASPTFKPNPLLPDTRSEMAVPLLISNKMVGVLDIQSTHAGSLTQDVLPAFEALAGQLAIAIQNANLLAETEQARAEVEKQAARLVRANWKDYLDAVHKPEQIGFLFDQNKVVPLAEDFQPPADGNTLTVPISVTGESLGTLVVEMNREKQNAQTTNLINIVARQVAQQIENLRLLESAERYQMEAEQAARRLTIEGWQAYLKSRNSSGVGYLYDLNEVRPADNGNEANQSMFTLPLKAREGTIGMLSVDGLTQDDKDSLELANAVAERLSAHIDSLRQHEQTQSALAQSEKLFDASRRLAQATDLQSLVKVAVESLGIAEIDRAILGILYYDSEGALEGMAIAANWSGATSLQATPVGTRYPKEALRAMSLFMGPEPLFFDDMLNDERVDEGMQEIPRRLHYRSVAALPLFVGSRQDAMLLLEGEQPHSFTAEEIRLFIALAPQLATILENRQQYEKAQHQAEREAMLNTINQKIQSATTVESVLQIAARELGHALGAPLTIAQLGLKNRSNGN